MSVEKRKYAKKKKAKLMEEKAARAPRIPSIPVFLYADSVEESGLVARYMVPVSGVVEQGIVVVDEFEGADSVPMVMKCGGLSVNFFAYKKPNKYEINLPLSAGDKIEVYSKNKYAHRFWITFSWRPGR